MRTDLDQWREPRALIETEALEAALGDADLRIVDCTTWLRPAEPGDDAPYRVEPGRSDYIVQMHRPAPALRPQAVQSIFIGIA